MTDEQAGVIAEAIQNGLDGIAREIRRAFGRDHGNIGFIGEIARSLEGPTCVIIEKDDGDDL